MPLEDFSHEEIVEYATTLYGNDWRTLLAQNLGLTRKQLVLTLASGDPMPESITIPFLSLIEEHLRKQEETTREIKKRIMAIRTAKHGIKQSKEERRTAS